MMLLLVLAAAIKCPGSKAPLHHASCEATIDFEEPCGRVQAEIVARAQGQRGWIDPHNHGTYTVVSESTSEVDLTRKTGSGKYTDKILLTFAGSDKCTVTACSESQVFSISDFGTNYCNFHDLYCTAAEGCGKEIEDLKYTEHVGSCTSQDATKCIVKPTDVLI